LGFVLLSHQHWLFSSFCISARPDKPDRAALRAMVKRLTFLLTPQFCGGYKAAQEMQHDIRFTSDASAAYRRSDDTDARPMLCN
jgi:hypothetical protein